MKISKSCSPSYTLIYVTLEQGEEVFCESGAMVALSAGITVRGKVEGGFLRSTLRTTLGEESFFMARYAAEITGSWVALAPRFPGDVYVANLTGDDGIILQSGSLLGHSSGVEVDLKYSGIRNALLKEGLFSLKASGNGLVFIASYGGIEEVQLNEGEELIVDTGHLVGWSENCNIQIGPLGGFISQAFTGEGLVAKITAVNDAKVLLQTRAEQALNSWLFPTRNENTRES